VAILKSAIDLKNIFATVLKLKVNFQLLKTQKKKDPTKAFASNLCKKIETT
jgi:hypothetical protein